MNEIDPHFDLYSVGLRPERLRWALVPARLVARRVLAAKIEAEMRFFTQLDRKARALEQRIDRLRGEDGDVESLTALRDRVRGMEGRLGEQLERLRSDYHQLAGMFWDREATSRRLATLEDRLLGLEDEVARLRAGAMDGDRGTTKRRSADAA